MSGASTSSPATTSSSRTRRDSLSWRERTWSTSHDHAVSTDGHLSRMNKLMMALDGEVQEERNAVLWRVRSATAGKDSKSCQIMTLVNSKASQWQVI